MEKVDTMMYNMIWSSIMSLQTCRELLTEFKDRKPNVLVQVAVLDAHEQGIITYACTEVVEGTRDPLFLTGVSLSPDWPVYEDSLIKLSVYDVKDKHHQMSSFLGSASFSVADLLQSKDQQLSLSLRTADDSAAVGTVVVSRLKMGEIEDGGVDHIATDTHQKCTLVCEPHGTTNDKDNGQLMNAVFKNPVCKVYRFQTTDNKWMLVREQMAECTLSFSIPIQLLRLYIQEDKHGIQELNNLGELSPHWDNLRKDVITRYSHLIKTYQETLAELEKFTGPSFKPSCSKAQKYLEFIPINLHTQRMRVTCPRKTEAFYDVITVGAPAAHYQGFKNGGLQKLFSRYEAEKKSYSTAFQCIYYSPEHTAKAREILSMVAQLQPVICGLAEHLLVQAQQRCSQSLREALKCLEEKTEQFVHSLKDELVKNALFALHAARPDYMNQSQVSTQPKTHLTQNVGPDTTPNQNQSREPNVVVCNNVSGSQTPPKNEARQPLKHQDLPHHKEYDEEEWATLNRATETFDMAYVRQAATSHSRFSLADRVWANVAKELNSVIAMVDKLQEQDNNNQESAPDQALADVITSHNPAADWREQLSPLVVALKDCVSDVADRASKSMSFVLLQEAACSTPSGLQLQQRRDTVFSQALAALACGFLMRLYAGTEDKGFITQLHTVGVVAQFESLLSTYSEEIGMLEDMEVGISDLQGVTFKITEAASDDPSNLQPTVTGRRDHYTVEVPLPLQAFQTLPDEVRQGKLLQVFPVLFNVGINEQQTIAERFGDISLQERINQRNFDILETYYKSLVDRTPLECLPSFQMQPDIKELLETLGQNVVTKKRKNVEILWLAGAICRRLNGIRFTSCKSAKDRTSMSVTLEQCALLRDEHQLHKDYFVRALDCMRREGCRIENVQKNIKCRKYAFNMLQLMAFPKYYRPPEGTYGKVDS
ncbi:type II inositol 3,4-bisphosphate 4-phosphatase isoform X3 [Silurus asotus]|uniref:Type II inositol 3,4-bisphosphate 4-phosphatase isoform X3 n=1 Tax=Silurus asotus TaxID=30991 RepID=A0AAD5AY74_SILAS|nr:type II inositol 3,4-bisphosphate 4-phosphatase isoform X3 [Silurus asotus]